MNKIFKPTPDEPDNNPNCCSEDSRRKFIVVSTLGVSAACAIFPVASGITTILDPVKKSSENQAKVPWTKVAPLGNLSELARYCF